MLNETLKSSSVLCSVLMQVVRGFLLSGIFCWKKNKFILS